jgi:hypothetical protein
MRGVVVVVNQVVQRAGVLRRRSQHLFENRGDLHLRLAPGEARAMALVRVGRADETARHRAEQRERVEGGDVRIVGFTRVQLTHRLGVRAPPRLGRAVTEQPIGGSEERLIPWPGGLRHSCGRRRRETRQRRAPSLDIFMAPQRLVPGHRLAPIGHRQGGIDLSSLDEGLVRVFVLEQVEGGDAALIDSVCAGLREGTSAERQQHARRRAKM